MSIKEWLNNLPDEHFGRFAESNQCSVQVYCNMELTMLRSPYNEVYDWDVPVSCLLYELEDMEKYPEGFHVPWGDLYYRWPHVVIQVVKHYFNPKPPVPRADTGYLRCSWAPAKLDIEISRHSFPLSKEEQELLVELIKEFVLA